MIKKDYYEVGFESKVFKVPKRFLDEYREEVIEVTKKEVIEDIPHSWLDSLFEDYLSKKDLTHRDIENLFLALKRRLKQRHLSTFKKEGTELSFSVPFGNPKYP